MVTWYIFLCVHTAHSAIYTKTLENIHSRVLFRLCSQFSQRQNVFWAAKIIIYVCYVFNISHIMTLQARHTLPHTHTPKTSIMSQVSNKFWKLLSAVRLSLMLNQLLHKLAIVHMKFTYIMHINWKKTEALQDSPIHAEQRMHLFIFVLRSCHKLGSFALSFWLHFELDTRNGGLFAPNTRPATFSPDKSKL